MTSSPHQTTEKLDLAERGALKDGQPQTLDRRLFMQLLAFGRGGSDLTTAKLIDRLRDKPSGLGFGRADPAPDAPPPLPEYVVYEDVNDPLGWGLLLLAEDPGRFLGPTREFLGRVLAQAAFKPEFTMLGRTYAIGYEPDLVETLLTRPRRTVLNPAWPWAVWYPLRRKGEFAQLPQDDQRRILGEHGALGHRFGAADHAHDIRLMCYGLDKNDNDFVVGLVGKELYPLSALVQAMRKTQQTSLYLEKLGPFFVGRAVSQAPITP